MSSKKQWIIKLKDGRIRGPLDTQKVLELIQEGLLTGEESISIYPGSNWFPITHDPGFYDQLLEALTDQQNQKQDYKDSESDFDPNTIIGGGQSDEFGDDEDTDPFIEHDELSTEAFESFDTTHKQTQSQNKTKTSTRTNHTTKTSKEEAEDEDTIELMDIKKANRKSKKQKAFLPIIIGFISIVFIFLLWPTEKDELGVRIRLQLPDLSGKVNASLNKKALLDSAVQNFLVDTFDGYKRAQNDFVSLLSADSLNGEAWSLLCVTYYELWPYTYQDNQDQKIIKVANQKVSSLIGQNNYSLTCKVVDLMVRGRLEEAKSITDSILNSGFDGSPPVVFYYLKAQQMKSSKEYDSGVGYAKTAQRSWPQWIALFRVEAQLTQESGALSQAYNLYSKIIKANPSHKLSHVESGVILQKHFNQLTDAQEKLTSALAMPGQISNQLTSKAYYTLAEISYRQNQKDEAYDNAKKAFAYNPTNVDVQNFLRTLGASKELEAKQVDVRQLISQGDQLFRENEFTYAKAMYDEAFRLDSKNGVAALKAAKSLWQLSQTKEAIQWLNKSIMADPKLIESYVTLAMYHASDYRFSDAQSVLMKAKAVNPESFEVMRGFAQMELIRRSFKTSINYAQQAIAINNTDVESYIILSKAYMEDEEYEKAFESASKAREMDVNDIDAQIMYSKALAGLQGIDSALQNIVQKIQIFPFIMEYRLALAELQMAVERFTEAEYTLAQILNIDKKNKKALILLGRVYRSQLELKKALRVFLRASIIDPADVTPQFETGLLYLMVSKPQQAIQQFKNVITLNERYPLAHFYLGKAYIDVGSYKPALEQAEKERMYNPNMSEPYELMAEAHMKLREFNACAKAYQEAISRQPEGVSKYIKAAKCYRLANNLTIAEQMLNEASRRESGNSEIYKEQGAIFEMKGEAEDAIYAYKQYLLLDPGANDRTGIERRIEALGGMPDQY